MTRKLPGTAYDYQRSKYAVQQHLIEDDAPRMFNVYKKRSRLEQQPRANFMTFKPQIQNYYADSQIFLQSAHMDNQVDNIAKKYNLVERSLAQIRVSGTKTARLPLALEPANYKTDAIRTARPRSCLSATLSTIRHHQEDRLEAVMKEQPNKPMDISNIYPFRQTDALKDALPRGPTPSRCQSANQLSRSLRQSSANYFNHQSGERAKTATLKVTAFELLE